MGGAGRAAQRLREVREHGGARDGVEALGLARHLAEVVEHGDVDDRDGALRMTHDSGRGFRGTLGRLSFPSRSKPCSRAST